MRTGVEEPRKEELGLLHPRARLFKAAARHPWSSDKQAARLEAALPQPPQVGRIAENARTKPAHDCPDWFDSPRGALSKLPVTAPLPAPHPVGGPTWKPPESVSMPRGQLMKLCSPPISDTSSLPAGTAGAAAINAWPAHTAGSLQSAKLQIEDGQLIMQTNSSPAQPTAVGVAHFGCRPPGRFSRW